MFQSANVSSDFSSKKSWSPMTQSSFATRFLRQPVRPPVADRLRPPELAVPRSAPQVTFCVRGVISPCLSNIFLHHVLVITLRRPQMDHAIGGTPTTKTVLYDALELSKNTWLLTLQLPDRVQPSLYPIKGGDTDGLMAKLMAAGDRWAKMSGKAPSIVLC